MVLLLSIILFTFAESARLNLNSKQLDIRNYNIEPDSQEGYSYTEYECASATTLYIKEVCDLCLASTAYVIPNADPSYLTAYDEETLKELDYLLFSARQFLPRAKYYAISVSQDASCLSLTEFIEDADYSKIWNYYLERDPSSVFVPEIFDIEKTSSLDYIAVRYSEKVFDYLSLNYDAIDLAKISDDITYNLERMYTYFENKNTGINEFSGVCEVSGSGLTAEVDFIIETGYDRKYGDAFDIVYVFDQKFTVKEWSSMIDSQSICDTLAPPSGLSTLENFEINGSYQEFVYGSTEKAMKVQNTYSFFNVSDWALAPEIYIKNAKATLVSEDDQYCQFQITGDWEYSSIYVISLTLKETSASGNLKISGEFISPSEISVSSIETDFYQKLFPEDTDMFPVFIPDDPNPIKRFKNEILISPKISLYIDPDLSYNIYGSTPGEAEIEVISARENSEIQFIINRLTSGQNLLRENGLEITKSSEYYSSSTIDTGDYPRLKSELDPDRSSWADGIVIEISTQFNSECENNDFCLILQKYLVEEGERIAYIDGYVVNNTVYLDAPIQKFPLSSSVDFEEAGLAAHYLEQGLILYIKGAFYLQVDSNTLLKFSGTIDQESDGKASLDSESTAVWKDVMEIENLWAAGVYLDGKIDGTGKLSDWTSYGSSFIGYECWDGKKIVDTCLEGSIDLYLDFAMYQFNYFSLSVFELTNIDFFNYFGGYSYETEDSMPLSLACFEFPVGVYFDHQYINADILISSDLKYCDVYGELDGKTASFKSGKFEMNITLEDFYFAKSNGILKKPKAVLDIDRSNAKSESEISGKLEIFNLESSASIIISNDYYTQIEGYMFDGTESFEVILKGDRNTKIQESDFTAEFYLYESDQDDLETIVRSSIDIWINHGNNVLQTSTNFISGITRDIAYLESTQCDPDSSCEDRYICPEGTYEICKSSPTTQTCLDGTGCENVELNCVDSETFCVKKKKNCGDSCECLSEITVCKKWESQCSQSSTDCRNKTISIDQSSCNREEITCDEKVTNDLECTLECDWNKIKYVSAQEDYDYYKDGYLKTIDEIRGFEEILYLAANDYDLEELIKISKIYKIRQIDSYIGPSDFNLTLKAYAISIESESLELFEYEMPWNFYEDRANDLNTYVKLKEFIIDHSSETLTDDLVYKDPVEILAENIDYENEEPEDTGVYSGDIISLLQIFNHNSH